MDTEPVLRAGQAGSGLGQRPAPRTRARLALRLAGGGLLIAAGAIHLDLYLTGYRSIPVIGGLFLFQVIAAFVLGVAVLASAARIVVAAGAVFSLATLGGYLLSLWIGLFGFREVRTTAGIAAGIVEVAAFAALTGLAAMPAERGPAGGRLLGRLWSGALGAWIAAVSVVALAVLGASVATAGGPATTAPGALKAVRISGVTVLADAKGRTLYWFAPDTATRSACYGSCAAYWPPVKGPATAGPGVTGTLSVLTRTGGALQAAYDGHPLYTYVGDRAPGQATGNGLNLNGGLWHEVTVSGN
jgi:predicted lipoprotein with Yx(FWY)xxD motif